MPTRADNQPKKPRSIIRVWYMMMGHKEMSSSNTSVKNNQVLTKLDHILKLIEECENRENVPDNWPIDITNANNINYIDILDYIGVSLYIAKRNNDF